MNLEVIPLPTSGPLFEGAIRVYADAFSEPPYSDPDRGNEIRDRLRGEHSRRLGFRALAAAGSGERVAGMIYGYRGLSGQWWHDTVARALPTNRAMDWLADSYELVELAVDPRFQRQGIATALIESLLDGRSERTCVLSTRTDSEAHHLYSGLGFEFIAEMKFTAKGAPFYVMGLRLGVSGD
ncbi:MAG: GNAT family N-acetyltransferase [Anaerolineaceae bacterium]